MCEPASLAANCISTQLISCNQLGLCCIDADQGFDHYHGEMLQSGEWWRLEKRRTGDQLGFDSALRQSGTISLSKNMPNLKYCLVRSKNNKNLVDTLE